MFRRRTKVVVNQISGSVDTTTLLPLPLLPNSFRRFLDSQGWGLRLKYVPARGQIVDANKRMVHLAEGHYFGGAGRKESIHQSFASFLWAR
jgi:hypothetical protein